jgi:hypothetical protein
MNQKILTAKMYSSLINENTSTFVGCRIMKNAFTENDKNNHKYKIQNKNKIYYKKVKHTRTHTIPEYIKLCTEITKKANEMCMCKIKYIIIKLFYFLQKGIVLNIQ